MIMVHFKLSNGIIEPVSERFIGVNPNETTIFRSGALEIEAASHRIASITFARACGANAGT